MGSSHLLPGAAELRAAHWGAASQLQPCTRGSGCFKHHSLLNLYGGTIPVKYAHCTLHTNGVVHHVLAPSPSKFVAVPQVVFQERQREAASEVPFDACRGIKTEARNVRAECLGAIPDKRSTSL